MASKTFIEIEIEQADKFRKLLDQVISKLEKLDGGLERVHQTVKGVNFKIQGIKDLERLGAFAAGFTGAANLKPFQNLVKVSGFLQQSNQILRGISPTTFHSLSQAVGSLVAVDSKLGMLTNLTSFRAASLSSFSTVVTNLVTLGAKASKMDMTGIMRLPLVINTFGTILAQVKNFASAGTVLRGVMQAATINSLLTTIESLLKVAKLAERVQPSSLAKITTLFLTVQTVMTSLRQASGGVLTVASARVALVSINSLASIITVLATVVKSASKIPPTALSELAMTMNYFTTILIKLRSISSIGDLAKGLLRGAVMKGIESFFVSLAVISNMGAKVKPDAFKTLSDNTDQILVLLKKIQGLATFGNAFKGFKATIALGGITILAQMIKTIGVVGGAGAKAMAVGLDQFSEMVIKMSLIANSGIFTVPNMIKITAMFLAFSLLAQIPTRMAISEGIINEFIAVGLALQRIGLALEKTLAVVQNIKISPLRLGIMNDLGRFAVIMKEFGKQLRKLVDALYSTETRVLFIRVQRAPVSTEQVVALAKLLGSTGRAMELMLAAVTKFGPAGSIDFSPLYSGKLERMKMMFHALRKGIQEILTVLQDTRPLYKKILGMGAGAPDAKGMEALAKLLTSLSSIIRRVFASMNSFTGGHFDVRADSAKNVEARIKFIQQLVNSFKGFTGKTLPPNLSPVLAKVPEILKALADVNSVDGGKGSANLKASVQGLKEFFNTLSKLNVKKTQALGDLGAALKLFGSIKALGSLKGLIDSVNQIVLMVNSTKIDRGSFKNLKGAAEEISRALRVIEKVKVTQTQVDAVRAMAEALGSITKTKIQPLTDNLVNMPEVRRTGELTGKELSGAVERGVVSGNLHTRLIQLYVSVGVSIMKALNPIAIGGKLVDGLQAIFHFGSQVIGVFDRIENTIRNLGSRIDQLGDQLVNLGNQLNQQAGLGTLMNTTAFTNAVDFDQLLTQVQVFGNLTTEELEQVRAAAVQVGIDFPQSAAEGLQAGLNLIKAGLGPAAVEATLPVAAALASLSDSGDLDRISEGIIQIVNSFEQLTPDVASSFDNASVVADTLASAADNSVASIESLMDGLKNVGPAARTFGLDLEQTTAILALFQQNGIEGAEAGTQLRTVLRTLQSAPAQAELRRLGVSLTDAEGNFRSVIDIVNDLNTAMNTPRTVRTVPGLSAEDQALMQDAQRAYAAASRNIRVYQNDLQATGLSEEQRAARLDNYVRQQQAAAETISRLSGNASTANAIFTEIDRTQAQNAQTILSLGGAYGQLGLSVLLSGDENAIQAFIEQMNAMPPAVDRARQMLDNFKGDVQQLQGSVETAGIVALQPLLDVYFRPMVQVLRGVVDGFLALPAPLQEAVGWFVALGSTLATVLGGSLVLTGSLTSLGGNVLTLLSGFLSLRTVGMNLLLTLTGMATGLATIAVVALPVVAVVGAIALGISTLRRVIEENIGGAGVSFTALKTTAGEALASLNSMIHGVVDFIGILFTGGRTTGGVSLEDVGLMVGRILSRMTDSIRRASIWLQQGRENLREFSTILTEGFNLDALNLADNTRILRNPILQWIFQQRGEALDQNSLRSFVNALQYAAQLFRSSLSMIGASVRTFLDNIGNGMSVSDAFNRLSEQIRLGGALLASSALYFVGNLFNIDFSEAISLFNQGNFTAGLQELLNMVLDRVRSYLLGNRETITDALTGIFNVLFVPGGMFQRIAGWLGLTDIENIIATLRGAVGEGFRGIVNTIFNILEGDDIRTALTKAFGPGIEPVLAFIDELGRAVNNITGIIGGLIKAVFSPEVTGAVGMDIGSLISSVFARVSGALKTLNDLVLGPLNTTIASINFDEISTFLNTLLSGVQAFLTNVGSGNWEAAAAGLGGALNSIFGTILGLFKSFFASGEGASVGSFVMDVGTAIASALQGALTFAFGTLATALGVDPEQFYADLTNAFAPLTNALATGDPFAIAGALAGAVVKAIGSAINLALGGIGELLNIDVSAVQTFLRDTLGGVVDQINSLFSGEGSLSEAVVSLIQSFTSAIKILFSAIQGAGDATNAQAILASFGDFLGGLSDAILGALSVPVNALRLLFSRIADMDATTVQIAMAAIGSVVALMAVQSLVSNIGALTSFIGKVSSPIAKAAAIFVIVDFLTGLISNIRELGPLAETDLPSIVNAILNTFVDLGADIAGILGFEDVANQIRGLKDTFLQVAAEFPIVAARMGSVVEFQIRSFMNQIIGGIQETFARARAEIESGANQLAGRGETFDAFRVAFADQLNVAITTAGEGTNLGAFFRNVVSQATVNGFDVPDSLRQEFIGKARQSLGELMVAFNTDLQESVATEDSAQVRQTVSDWFLLITGIGDPQFAFDTILQQGDYAFAQTMLDTIGSMTAEELASANIDAGVMSMLSQSILDAFHRGMLTQEQALTLLEVPLFTELSPEDAARAREQIQAFIDQVQAVVDETTAAEPIEVKGNLQITSEKRGGKGDAEDLGLTGELLGISDAFVAIQTQAAAASEQVPVAMGYMTITAAPLLAMMGFGLTTVRDRVTDIVTGMFRLSTTFLLSAPVIATQTAAIQTGITAMANSAVADMDRLIGKLNDVKYTLEGVMGVLGQINTFQPAPQYAGGTTPTPHARGGSTAAGRTYEVLEGGRPELYKSGDKFYMLSPTDGRVIPLSNQTVPRAQAGGANSGSVSINYSPQISINIDGAGTISEGQLAKVVREKLVEANAQQRVDIERMLRIRGRSGA